MTDSHSEGLLSIRIIRVPRSSATGSTFRTVDGNHAAIENWRREQSLARTLELAELLDRPSYRKPIDKYYRNWVGNRKNDPPEKSFRLRVN